MTRESDHPVSIVICTFNRHDDLAETLDVLRGVRCREVIVVNNGCTDGTGEMLSRRDDVRVLTMDRNHGVPGFGIGAQAATSPYVLLLDDDATPEPGVPDRLAAMYDADPSVAAVACRVVTPEGVVVTEGWPDNPLLFWGCGAGVRRQWVDALGDMFYPRLRLHGTELDFCIRLYGAGQVVRYAEDLVVVHRFSSINRTQRRRLRTTTHASVRFCWDHFRARTAIRSTARSIGYRLRQVQDLSGLFGVAEGLLAVLRDVPDIRSRRSVVPVAVENRYVTEIWEYARAGANPAGISPSA